MNRVIVAHEEAEIRASAAKVAEAAGCEVVSVSDGESVRSLLHSEPVPSVLVVDVALPRILAYELCAEIKNLRLDTKVILIASVYSKTAYKRRPTSLYGADDYVEQHHILDQLPDKLRLYLTEIVPPAHATPANSESDAAIRQAGEARLAFRYRTPAEGRARAMSLARLLVADALLYAGDQVESWLADCAGRLPDELARDVAEVQRLFLLRVPEEIAAAADFVSDALEDFARARRSGMATKMPSELEDLP